jgi:hypothetical protein
MLKVPEPSRSDTAHGLSQGSPVGSLNPLRAIAQCAGIAQILAVPEIELWTKWYSLPATVPDLGLNEAFWISVSLDDRLRPVGATAFVQGDHLTFRLTNGSSLRHSPQTRSRRRTLRGVAIVCAVGLAAHGGCDGWHQRPAAPKNALEPNSTAPPQRIATMNVAFILLSTRGLPKSDEVVAAFGSFASKEQRLRARESEDKKPSQSEILEFELSPGGKAFVAAMPVPVPNGEADSAAGFSIASYGTGWTLPKHTAHLVVTLQGSSYRRAIQSGEPRTRSCRFTTLHRRPTHTRRYGGLSSGESVSSQRANCRVRAGEKFNRSMGWICNRSNRILFRPA